MRPYRSASPVLLNEDPERTFDTNLMLSKTHDSKSPLPPLRFSSGV